MQEQASDVVFMVKPIMELPYVKFDRGSGTLLIGGYPRAGERDKITRIYDTLEEHISDFYKSFPERPLVVSMQFDNFDSLNAKLIARLIKKIMIRCNSIIYWYYFAGDDDSLEAGLDFKEYTKAPIITRVLPDEIKTSLYFNHEFPICPGTD